jgi:hypothetical protein
MKLDRNLNPDGKGKYELRNLRTGEIITDCGEGEEHEFFVIMLKDRHALPALASYAASIFHTDPEFAAEVRELCKRAGKDSKWCAEPD